MSKRIYEQTIYKWAIGIGIPSGIAFITLLFLYLQVYGLIDVTGHSGDIFCDKINEPCVAFVNFTATEDIFLYPLGYDPYGRTSPFSVDKNIKQWKIYRSWGTGWREIDLTEICKGTWCGGKYGLSTNVYSFAFREGRDYQIRIEIWKEDPRDSIKWNFANLDPWIYGRDINSSFEYSINKRSVTFRNDEDSSLLSQIDLVSNFNENIIYGPDRNVFTIKINNSINDVPIDVLLNKLSLYDLKNEGNSINKPITFKIKNYTLREVTKIDKTCDVFSGVGNGTPYRYEHCVKTPNGTKFIDSYDWIDIDKDYLLPIGITEIGAFTDVSPGEQIEWIPHFYNERNSIDEWSVWTESLTSNLSYYWNMTNENATYGPLNLTFVGSPTFSETHALLGSAVNTTPGGNYLTAPQTDVMDIRNFNHSTINMWMRVTVPLTDRCYIWWDGDTGSDNAGICTVNTGQLRWRNTFINGNIDEAVGTASVGNWRMITLKRNDTGVYGYINASLFEFIANPYWRGDGGLLRVGQVNTDGLIDEVGYWNRSLSDDEIIQLFNNGTGISFVSFGPDTTPPIVTINFPQNQSYGSPSIPFNFNVSLNENGTVMYSLDGGLNNLTMISTEDDISVFGILFNYTNYSIADGQYTMNVYANDTAGNTNYTTQVLFSLETINPGVVINFPANQSYGTTPLDFNVTLDENGTVSYTLDDGLNNVTMDGSEGNEFGFNFNYSNTSIAGGSYIFKVYANDTLGNNNHTESVTFYFDSVPPIVTINVPLNTTYTSASINFNVSLNENGTVMYSLDSGTTNFTMTGDEGNEFGLSFNYTNSSIGEGGYSFIVYANDTFGNQNHTASVSFSINFSIVDIGINITLSSGIFDFIFNASNTTGLFQPMNQTDVKGVITVHNNYSSEVDIQLKLNETLSNITLYTNDIYDFDTAITVNTSYQIVNESLQIGNTTYLWFWAEYNDVRRTFFPALDIIST